MEVVRSEESNNKNTTKEIVFPRDMKYGLKANDVPHCMRWDYIETGYRLGGDYKQCLASLFKWHNQTLNAWTMIITSIVLMSAIVWVFAKYHPTPQQALPFIALFVGILIHMPLSVMFHICHPISLKVHEYWREMDTKFIFIGSVLVTLATSWFVFGPMGSLVAVALNAAISYAIIKHMHLIDYMPYGNVIDMRYQVALVSVMFAIIFAPIVVHSMRLLMSGGKRKADVSGIFTAVGIMFAAFVFGAWVFVAKVPEKWYDNGEFDLVGSSHQLSHLCITVGVLALVVWLTNFIS